MGKKLTYMFVKESFEREGYTLLSTEYKNSKVKLDYRCQKGHEHSIRWNDWAKGVRCPYCAGLAKLDMPFIKKSFEKEGYILLSKDYCNSRVKLKYICPNGHKSSISWDNWREGHRCAFCVGNVKKSVEEVRNSFAGEGYEALLTEYINSENKFYCVCPEGHKYLTSWHIWRNGYRCPHCAGQIKPTLEFIQKSFSSENYILLTNVYKNNKTKLKYKCPEGHTHALSWSDWKNGIRCPYCAYHNLSILHCGSGNPAWQGGKTFEKYCEIWKDQEYKYDIRERDGHKCLNPYCNSKDPNDLTIHHIDYNKQNCKPSNLITVCRSCNTKANTNRTWHKLWYKAIMHKRYGLEKIGETLEA